MNFTAGICPYVPELYLGKTRAIAPHQGFFRQAGRIIMRLLLIVSLIVLLTVIVAKYAPDWLVAIAIFSSCGYGITLSFQAAVTPGGLRLARAGAILLSLFGLFVCIGSAPGALENLVRQTGQISPFPDAGRSVPVVFGFLALIYGGWQATKFDLLSEKGQLANVIDLTSRPAWYLRKKSWRGTGRHYYKVTYTFTHADKCYRGNSILPFDPCSSECRPPVEVLYNPEFPNWNILLTTSDHELAGVQGQ
jgi:hypothetical protein